MIYIREIIPRKFSGKSSFLISFQYDPKIVEAIKTLPAWYYHKKDLCWEVPSDCLADALDTLTFLDDLQLIMLPDENEIETISENLTEEEIRSLKFKPFAHQIDAINFGLQKKHKKWLLLDSMGLG